MKSIELFIIDDDIDDIKIMKRALKESKSQFKINEVHDGVEALEYLNQNGDYSDARKPDIILMDLNMPRKDGRETIAEIKSDESLKKIPIIVMTTSSEEEDVHESYAMGCNSFMTKPMDPLDFKKALLSFEEYWVHHTRIP